ncbi:TetR/AcrR family transcriptional regulator [Acinetobacter sp. NCu2D-2]|uniref:TetR/AcrR family transcriptional regulator n=1 Tax=Acinetobacter sp. NCu2D-2 TaxID=1608473 RepID=UPI001488C341|nr:TetR/AcrR family transcriptional regulator [Acinetobacter sp. NCu2D-2]
MQITPGRPKDLEKRQRILDAAKNAFLSHGYHGSNMNEIAKDAGVTKLTVYNHFQDKANLFACAIKETCASILHTLPIQLNEHSNFAQAFYDLCELAMDMVHLPEAIKLDLLLMELSAQQNPLVQQFYQAAHVPLQHMWKQFLLQAQHYHFIQVADVEQQIELLGSLLFGFRHQKILLGVKAVPTPEEKQQIIQDSIEIFLLRYPAR